MRDWWRHRRAYRAFKRLPADERNIVFYAETGQDWHHLAPLIEELTGRHGRTVCYLSSDPKDPGLTHDRENLHAFCIGEGLLRIVLFQILRADVMVLTMMDLDNLHLKRSKHPVHYIYVFHSLSSTHMLDYASSYDHYDTVLCAGPHHIREIRRREELAGLPPKELIEHGYHRLEQLIRDAERQNRRPAGDSPRVLVAPTWGEHSLLNVCGETLLEVLLEAGLEVTLRPHYQTRRLHPDLVNRLLECFSGHERFHFVGRMGESGSIVDSDLLVCDWSGMAIEYALGLARPVLFIDVPRRVRNPEYEQLGLEPVEAAIREEVGAVLHPDELGRAPNAIRQLLAEPAAHRREVEELRPRYVFNLGRSAEVGAAEIARIADERARARHDREAAYVEG